jgi:hypothetical protein
MTITESLLILRAMRLWLNNTGRINRQVHLYVLGRKLNKVTEMNVNILKRAIMSKSFTWAARTLLGNIVLGVVCLGFPLGAIFAYYSHLQGILTSARYFQLITICGSTGAVFGVIIWSTLTRPLLKGRSSNTRYR